MDTYYGVFDAEGAPQAFYASDIYPLDAIPAEAVEISYGDWQALLNGQPRARYRDGAVVMIDPPEPREMA
jgi:hypothetical protein